MLTTSVLQLLQAGDDNRTGCLLDVVLGCTDHVLRGYWQQVISAVVSGVAVFSKRQFLVDDVTARDGLGIPTGVDPREQAIVFCYVVSNLARTTLYGRGNDV